MLKCYHLGGKGGANLPSQRTSNTISQGRGLINYVDDDDSDENDDDDNDYHDDYDVFS